MNSHTDTNFLKIYLIFIKNIFFKNEQEEAIIFCKEPGMKYFWLYGPFVTVIQLHHCSMKTTTDNT